MRSAAGDAGAEAGNGGMYISSGFFRSCFRGMFETDIPSRYDSTCSACQLQPGTCRRLFGSARGTYFCTCGVVGKRFGLTPIDGYSSDCSPGGRVCY